MTEKTRSLLIPQYVKEFSCIGSACEDSCCTGWRVNIDEATYKKYKRDQDKELKPLFKKNIIRNRSNPSSDDFAKIKMGKEGRCSFLSEENLCKVQLNLGEDFLSNTCTTFPRSLNRINGVVEKSLTMSCPEAARLALLNPNGIEFDETEELNRQVFIAKELDTSNPNLMNKPIKYFWELRIFTIQVLQDRTYSLNERLIFLGLFFRKVQEAVDHGKLDSIQDIIAHYATMMANGGAKSVFSNDPTHLAIQMELCKELLDYRVAHGIGSERYKNCLSETLQGIEYTNESNIEEVAEKYKEAFEEYYKPFMSEHEYILENYLVNYVFKNLFPFGNKNMFEDYVMLILHYSMIKLHLIGMAGFHKCLTIELVITLIQSFSKSVEHNNVYLKRAFNLLRDNGYTTMAYMAILIKN
ncbi:flagellin lysine-N-methylase [Peribacillus frigoritolerans]|uniref:flagellin lysine-N-methylase n=1 Tax=Peribacillus frigoritolerans TaxID=450367 RepID=UPI00105A6FD4|nr:flagellin lysine-N-methylase [Peribacillus frigoritolerans]TDL78927.1 lysine-N-methylase [Peribacillus frigoritolerans]